MAKKPEVPKREAARKRYVESDIGLRDLSDELDIGLRTLARWSKDEDWPQLRQRHSTTMATLRQQALQEAHKSEAVKDAAKDLANDLDKYRKALDFGLGLVIKGLREPSLAFKDLGQGIGSLAKLVQIAATLNGDEVPRDIIPDELKQLAAFGGAYQPAPRVFTAPGADGDPR